VPARHLHVADPLDELRDLLATIDPDQLEIFLAGCTPEDLELVEQVMSTMRHHMWQPLPHQIPPDPEDPAWLVWMLYGGRGIGKTDACAKAMDDHAKGPACLPGIPGGHRMAIIAPTKGDASDACVNGPSGLRTHNPAVTEITRKGGTFVVWPNGAEAKEFGAYTKQDVERLRAGGNRCAVWVEELCAWRYLRACWNHMMLGLRLGQHPRVWASTTPKNRAHFLKILAADTTVISTATTYDNPHLADSVRQRYFDTYANTRLGKQELMGEILKDVEGALWTDAIIEPYRVEQHPALRRIVVAVDPSWGTTNDECGIIVAGKGWDNQGYVLADYSIRGGPQAWAENAAEAYYTCKADKLVAEGNFQGEQVRLAMKQVQHPLGPPPFALVTASRGKQLRAEPVVMLYEQGRIHHVGALPMLEHQMTTWVPAAPKDEDEGDDAGAELVMKAGAAEGDESETDADEPLPSDFSPDRVDALVFSLTDLMLGNEGPARLVKPKAKGAGPKPRPAGAAPAQPVQRRGGMVKPRGGKPGARPPR
jgi:phage terminase large subunit-like protein